MPSVKVSVSLPTDDVAFLDEYASALGIGSRSAVLHRAVSLLRADGLGAAYEEAWADWANSEDADLWDNAVADGLA